MGKKEKDNVWLIAYIHRDYINKAEEEIKYYGHEDVEVYIPTVRVLQKKFKGKNIFEFVPLLFNYGFLKVPYYKACDPEYLIRLKTQITCIYGWVKDPAKIQVDKTGLRRDNANSPEAIPSTAMATDKEVAELITSSQSMSIFNKEDMDRIQPGDHIKLQGYPFENMPAEIISIDHRKGEIKVKLDIESIMREVTVAFENVFYTVYKNFEEESRESSSDEMNERFGFNVVENILSNNYTVSDDEE